MQLIGDLHLHSKYSRAVSQQMELKTMAEWAEKKGIDILATGDWTHPLWFKELETLLEEAGDGVYKLKGSSNKTSFVLATEIANIFTQGGKARRIHTVFIAPSLAVVRKINDEIKRRGGNVMSDGRPILGMSLMEMCDIVWGVDERVIVVPSHIWTPWFSMFGSKSGFDSVEEAFGEHADRIKAIETGLSSDVLMNWKIKDLDNRAIVSFGDAHSPKKLGREATVFEFKQREFGFDDLAEALKGNSSGLNRIAYTIEFHPEEGKYHYTGHRNCGVVQSPEQTRKQGTICHVCGKPLTVGVEHRVDELGDEDRLDWQAVEKTNDHGVVGYFHPQDKTRPPYVMLVPLEEIIIEALGVASATNKVEEMYLQLISQLGTEFEILLKTDLKQIAKTGGEKVAEGIKLVRQGKIVIKPGYDGVFGVVKIWADKEEENKLKSKTEQQSLF